MQISYDDLLLNMFREITKKNKVSMKPSAGFSLQLKNTSDIVQATPTSDTSPAYFTG